jgi:hypothetical protein
LISRVRKFSDGEVNWAENIVQHIEKKKVPVQYLEGLKSDIGECEGLMQKYLKRIEDAGNKAAKEPKSSNEGGNPEQIVAQIVQGAPLDQVSPSKYHVGKKAMSQNQGIMMRKLVLWMMILSLEWVATLDLATDLQITRMLWENDYSVWMVTAILSQLVPFYVSYVPFVTYLRERLSSNG